MCQKQKREEPFVHPVGVVDPLGKDRVLDTADQPGLEGGVLHRVCRHIEEQKVLLFRGQNALLSQVLGQAFTDVL